MDNIQSEISSGNQYSQEFPRKRRLSLPMLFSSREIPDPPASPSTSSERGTRGRKKTCREFDQDLTTISLNWEAHAAEAKEPARTRSEGRRRRRAARRKRRKEAKIERKRAETAEEAYSIVAEGTDHQSKDMAETMDGGMRADTNENRSIINAAHTSTAPQGSNNASNVTTISPQTKTGFAVSQHAFSGMEMQQRGRPPKGRQHQFTDKAKPLPSTEAEATIVDLKNRAQSSSLPSNRSLDQPEAQTPLDSSQQNAKLEDPPDTRAADPKPFLQQKKGSPSRTPPSGDGKHHSAEFLKTKVHYSPAHIQGKCPVSPTKNGKSVGLPLPQQLQPPPLVALENRVKEYASEKSRHADDDGRLAIPNDAVAQKPLPSKQHGRMQAPPTQTTALSELSPRQHNGVDKYSSEIYVKEDRPLSPYSLPESISYATATIEVSTDQSQVQPYGSSLLQKYLNKEHSLSQATSTTSEQETSKNNSGSSFVASPRLHQPSGTAINDSIGIPGQPKHSIEEFIFQQSSVSDMSNCSSRVSAAQAFWTRRTQKVSSVTQKLIVKQQQQSEDDPPERNNWSDVCTHVHNGWDGCLSDDNDAMTSEPKTGRLQSREKRDTVFGSPGGTLSDSSMPLLQFSSVDLLDAESVYIRLAHFAGGEALTPNTSFQYDGWELASPYHHFALEAESDEEFWNRLDVDMREYEDMNTLELVKFALQKIRRYRAVLVIQRWWRRQLAKKSKNREGHTSMKVTPKRHVRTGTKNGGWWHQSGFRRRLFGRLPSPPHSISSSSQAATTNDIWLSQETASVVIQHCTPSLDKRDEGTPVNFGWARIFDQTPRDEGYLHRFNHAKGNRNRELDVLRLHRWWRGKARLSGHPRTASSESGLCSPKQRESTCGSAVLVQRCWRKQECSLHDKHNIQAKVAAAIVIQRWWSSILDCRKLAESVEAQASRDDDKSLRCQEIAYALGLQNSHMVDNLHFAPSCLHRLNATSRIQRPWRQKSHRDLKQRSVFTKDVATPLEIWDAPGKSITQDSKPAPPPPETITSPAAPVCVAPAQDLRPFADQKDKKILIGAEINTSLGASDGSRCEESLSQWIGNMCASCSESSLGCTESSVVPEPKGAFKAFQMGMQEKSKGEQAHPAAGKSRSGGVDWMHDDNSILTGPEMNRTLDASDGSQSEESASPWNGDTNMSHSEAPLGCTESSTVPEAGCTFRLDTGEEREDTMLAAGNSGSTGLSLMQDDKKILTDAEINGASDANNGSQSGEAVSPWIGGTSMSCREAALDCTESSAVPQGKDTSELGLQEQSNCAQAIPAAGPGSAGAATIHGVGDPRAKFCKEPVASAEAGTSVAINPSSSVDLSSEMDLMANAAHIAATVTQKLNSRMRSLDSGREIQLVTNSENGLLGPPTPTPSLPLLPSAASTVHQTQKQGSKPATPPKQESRACQDDLCSNAMPHQLPMFTTVKREPWRMKPTACVLADGHFQSASDGFLAQKTRPSGDTLTSSEMRRRRKNVALSRNEQPDSEAGRGLMTKLSRFLQSNPTLTSIILAGKSTELIPNVASRRSKKLSKANRKQCEPSLQSSSHPGASEPRLLHFEADPLAHHLAPNDTEVQENLGECHAEERKKKEDGIRSPQRSPVTFQKSGVACQLFSKVPNRSSAAALIQCLWTTHRHKHPETHDGTEESQLKHAMSPDAAASTIQHWLMHALNCCQSHALLKPPETEEDKHSASNSATGAAVRAIAHVLPQQTTAAVEVDHATELVQIGLDEFAVAAVIQRWRAFTVTERQNGDIGGFRGASAQAEQFHEAPQSTSVVIIEANKTAAKDEDLSASSPNRIVTAGQIAGGLFEQSQPSLTFASGEMGASFAQQTGNGIDAAGCGACELIQKWWKGVARAHKKGAKPPNNPRHGTTHTASLGTETWQALLGLLQCHERSLAPMDGQLLAMEKHMEHCTASTLNQRCGSVHSAKLDDAAVRVFNLDMRPSEFGHPSEIISRVATQNSSTADHAQKKEDAPSGLHSSSWATAVQHGLQHDAADVNKSGPGPLEAEQTFLCSSEATNLSHCGDGISSRLHVEKQQPMLSSSEAVMVIHHWWKGRMSSQQALPLEQEPVIATIAPHEAALVIQQWWKCAMAMHSQHETRLNSMPPHQGLAGLTSRAAATHIQQYWRESSTRQSRTAVASLASRSQIAQQQAVVLSQPDPSENSVEFAGGIAGIQENTELLTHDALVESHLNAQRSVEVPQLVSSSDNHDFTGDIQSIQESLELLMQERLEGVKPSRAFLSWLDRRPFVSGQKETFLSLLKELSHPQEQSIELWKASASHDETMMLEASATKVQSCWRMYVTKKNYVRLVTATDSLPGMTLAVMASRISGPKVWGSRVQCHLRSRIPNQN